MADNVTAEAVVTPGAVFASDDQSGVQHPYVKLEWGADNVYTKVTTGGDALPIQDGGNSITVDNAALSVVGGGVEATAVRVTLASDSTGVLSVDDNGGSLTVDGTVTANAGTNLNTSALALETGGNLAAAAISLAILDSIVIGSEAQVDIVAALPAGTNNIGDVDIASIAAGDNNIGNVDVVTLPALPAGTNNIGNVGHGKTIKSVSGGITADTDVIAAVSTKRLKVIAYSLTTVGTTANTVLFKSNGAAGTELWRVLLQAPASVVVGANLATAAPSFLFATVAGEKLTLDVSGSDTVHYSISYFDDDAT